MKALAASHTQALRDVQLPFDILGQKTWILGNEPEQANATRLAVNYMLARATGATGDALARGYEVSQAGYIDLFTSMILAVPFYKGYRGAIEEESIEDGGSKLTLGRTDTRLYMDTFYAGEAIGSALGAWAHVRFGWTGESVGSFAFATAALIYQQTERTIAHGDAA